MSKPADAAIPKDTREEYFGDGKGSTRCSGELHTHQ